MTTSGDYWWVWCGAGPAPDGQPAQGRPVTARAGDRTFAAYPLADPPWGQGLEIGVETSRVAAIVGWLANGDEMRSHLGVRPAMGTGADLVLGLYRRHGAEGLARLRGSYAVLVWDGERDTLVATHDLMGNHPLFWARKGAALVFSDSVETLQRRGGVSTELNRPALADFLRHRLPDHQETFFSAIRRVPPGHTLTAHGGDVRVRRTWTPGERPGSGSPATARDEFDACFARATSRCLGLGPAGVWLSGGLDSVSVATLARDKGSETGLPPPVALSLRFPDPGVNEEQLQRAVAARLDLPLVMLDLEESVAPRGLLEAALELAGDWPTPLLSPWLSAYLALGRAGVDRGCRAILTGNGGDEWLGVSPYLAADLIASLDFGGLARLALAGRGSYQMSVPRMFYNYLWYFGARRLIGRRLLPRWAPGLLDRHERRHLARATPPWLAPDPDLRRRIDARQETYGAPESFYAEEVRRSLDYTVVALEQEELFEASRRLGVPILAPFLDPDLVELVYSLPPEVLNRGGRSKGLVRSMLDRRFPALAFAQQRKVEATGTLERLLATESTRLRRRMGSPAALERLGVVDAARLEASIGQIASGGSLKSRWTELFQLHTIEVFARLHC